VVNQCSKGCSSGWLVFSETMRIVGICHLQEEYKLWLGTVGKVYANLMNFRLLIGIIPRA